MAIADQLSRLNELRQNLAAALTDKGVAAAETEGLETLVPKVGTIETGVQLPELTNPATAADIASGKQAINAAGEVVEGTMEKGYKLKTGNLSLHYGGKITISFDGSPIIFACYADIKGERFTALCTRGGQSVNFTSGSQKTGFLVLDSNSGRIENYIADGSFNYWLLYN